MKQYLKLLMAREGKEVLGRRGSNLLILTFVLIATFASIAFSEGSMLYLKDKMEDPFTNWVTINKATDNEHFIQFRDSLNEEHNRARFGFSGVTMDQYNNYSIMGIDESHIHYLSARFFENIETSLVDAILSEDNLVDGCRVDRSILTNKTLGFIITQQTARRLGYDDDNLPAYINYLAANEGADELGLTLLEDKLYPVPIPVLAVVRRLPNNVDMMSSNYFYVQQHLGDAVHPFDFTSHEEYLHRLSYFVSDEVGFNTFKEDIKQFVPDSLKGNFKVLEDPYAINLKPWKPGRMAYVYIGEESLDINAFHDFAEKVEKQYDANEVRRIHKLATVEKEAERGSFISIEFKTLDKIRQFESFAKDCGIQLEMAQVASKENFNAVTVVARILSAAMVIFSIICIIMFLVNMLQSYFQKVKRNIGTFKAFGINALELIQVYVLILIMIVVAAVMMALVVTWLIQEMLPYCGIEKDGFNYLSLWNATTYIATIVIIISTIVTVCVVMIKMLSKTPGDLIYDRN